MRASRSEPFSGPLLQIENLTTGFKRLDGSTFTAVDGVDLTLERGRALAIVGESGSGKSVTMRSMLGLLPKNGRILDGTALFQGKDLLTASERSMRSVRGKQIGMVFQNAMEALNPTISVGKQLCEALTWHRLCSKSEAKARAIRTLGDVGINEPERRFSMFPFQFSGGMRQRVMVAMALIAEPDLIIADEPTTALDVTVQAQVLDLLADIKDRGTGMIMVTHDLGVARRFCEDMVVMNSGKVVESGDITTVLDSPTQDYTKMLLSATLEVGDVSQRPATLAVENSESRSAPADTGSELLIATNLNKTFDTSAGQVHAVNDVSLAIAAGTTLGLVGESGSGKSTVARLVMGLQKPDSGQVLVDGKEIHGAGNSTMQMVFQNPYGSLIPQYTAGTNITEAMRLQDIGTKASRRERAAELLELVGLSAEDALRYPQQFSGGQQQRIAIARALAPEPEVLVCDEPTSSLDVSIQAQILALLEEIQGRLGVAVLLISHNLAVVEKMSDHVAVMRNGEIVEQGTREQVFSSPTHPYTLRLIEAILPVRSAA